MGPWRNGALLVLVPPHLADTPPDFGDNDSDTTGLFLLLQPFLKNTAVGF